MPSSAGTTKTVLVADDTAFVRDRFKAALEQAGHRVVPIKSAAELLARIVGLGDARDDPADPLPGHLVEDRAEEPLLALEVPVDGALDDLGLATDLVHARAGVAAFRE